MQSPDRGTTSRLLKNVSAEAGTRLLYLATRFFIPPFILGHVGMQAYGLYGAVFMLVAYFGISSLGFSNAYIRYVAQFAASGKTGEANRLLSTGMTLMTGVGVAGFSAVFFGWPLVAKWLNVPPALWSEGRELTLMIVGIFFAYLAFSVFRDALTGMQLIGMVQKVWAGSFLAETALIFSLVGAGMGLRGLGLAFVIRTLIDIVAHCIVAKRQIPWLRVRFTVPDRDSLRLLLRFGGIVQLNSVIAIFLSSVERMIAAPVLGLEACGLLDIGNRFPSMATSIPGAFASSVLPSASDLHARSGDEALTRLYLTTSRYMSAVSGSLFAFLTFFAAPCLAFWLGKVPEGAVPVLILFSIGYQVHMLTGPGTSLVKAAGKPRLEFHYSLVNVAALLITVPAARFFNGSWSLLAIATAVPLATVLSATWFLVVANREMGAAPSRFASDVLLPGLLPHVCASAVAIPLGFLLPAATRWQAAAVLASGGALYLIVLGVAAALLLANSEERELLRGAIAKLSGAGRQTAPAMAPLA